MMAAHVLITYHSSVGVGFTHNADFRYDPAVQNFKPKSSETKPRHG